MDAYTFRRHDRLRDLVQNPRGTTSNKRTLNFQGTHIALSGLLAEQLNVTAGSHLAFTYDENKPDHIYVRTADNADDTRDIQHKLSLMRKDCNRLRCTNTAVVQHVLQQVGAKTSCTCYVSPTPIDINGKEHYQILVSCPVMVK